MICRALAYLRRVLVLFGTSLLLLVSPSATWGQTPMTPEAFLGHPVGADYHLTTYERAMEWFDHLAEHSGAG